MIYASDCNLKTVNFGHFQALVRKTQYVNSIISVFRVCLPSMNTIG